jgi:hypothetical protein
MSEITAAILLGIVQIGILVLIVLELVRLWRTR